MSIDTEVPSRLDRPRWDLCRRRADELTAAFSVPPIPVLEIAERSGVDVIFDPFDKYADTVAGFCDFANRRLYVNSADPLNRQTFTIAHELGHWILHRDYFLAHPDRYPVLARFQRVDRSNPFEQEANKFAANLLVPRRLLAPVKNAPITALASIFAVSREMMEIRLQDV